MNKRTEGIEALINHHAALAMGQVSPAVPESLEVRRYRWRLEAQARFDASPVWKRGL